MVAKLKQQIMESTSTTSFLFNAQCKHYQLQVLSRTVRAKCFKIDLQKSILSNSHLQSSNARVVSMFYQRETEIKKQHGRQ